VLTRKEIETQVSVTFRQTTSRHGEDEDEDEATYPIPVGQQEKKRQATSHHCLGRDPGPDGNRQEPIQTVQSLGRVLQNLDERVMTQLFLLLRRINPPSLLHLSSRVVSNLSSIAREDIPARYQVIHCYDEGVKLDLYDKSISTLGLDDVSMVVEKNSVVRLDSGKNGRRTHHRDLLRRRRGSSFSI